MCARPPANPVLLGPPATAGARGRGRYPRTQRVNCGRPAGGPWTPLWFASLGQHVRSRFSDERGCWGSSGGGGAGNCSWPGPRFGCGRWRRRVRVSPASTLVEAEWPASVLACVGHIRAVGPARDAPRDAALRLSCCPAVSKPRDP